VAHNPAISVDDKPTVCLVFIEELLIILDFSKISICHRGRTYSSFI